MKRSVALVALALLVLMTVVAGLCVTGEVLRAVHVDASEGCCGLAHCSVAVVTMYAVAPFVAVATAGVLVASLIRSSTIEPTAPPPELRALRFA
ncbi:MAG: hypothetical protein ACREKS_09685 [Candidatus Rokuibacteriota bacterium]